MALSRNFDTTILFCLREHHTQTHRGECVCMLRILKTGALCFEKKLKKEPNDLQGWLILSRTCVLSGHYQKADKYYKNALELFPKNENILLEIALLKKKTNQTESAEKYLNKLEAMLPNLVGQVKRASSETITGEPSRIKSLTNFK